VNPVVLGKVRAKQDQLGDTDRHQVLPILLHGDAAFAGQGVVAECFGLSGLKGHRTGGTIHIVVNNQIGFTTAPSFSRSSPYPTDIALMVEAPIFHVNGDDPEAVVHAAKVATEFRQTFHKDVVLDIFCYRRFGHNEGDEPMFTNPAMYNRIRKQKTTLQLYTERLVKDGLIPEGEIEDMKAAFQARLNEEFEVGKDYKPNKADWLDGRWKSLSPKDLENYQRGVTSIKPDTLAEVGRALTRAPEGFDLHKTVARQLDAKAKMFESGKGFDWATAEALAFGSLQTEGFPVRLAGQDCTRGTFSQRHSGFIDQTTEERYYPLNHIRAGQARYEVIDSMLSEYAVLGFEYGYSLSEPNALTMWEAQFGDFANGAQIMFDQFINSGEAKWLRMSGLVCLLPHGFEGQGPEHSSARLERFLQLSAHDNWIVANCTTPANYFHILRRQLHRDFRKPLILMTPKSLLRHPLCISEAADFTDGSSFHRVMWDDAQKGNSTLKLKSDDKIKRVVLCSGKVYFDLLAERDAKGLDDVYLLRVEQLYPVPAKSLAAELSRFKDAEIIWCQEEPKNQGAWLFIEPEIEVKKPGDTVKQDEMLCELETDKVSVEVPSPVSGVLAEILAPEGTTVAANARLAIVTEGAVGAAPKAAEAPKAAAPAPAPVTKDIENAPSAKKAMEEAGLTAAQVQGTGRDGRVMKEDVARAAAAAPVTAAPAPAAIPRAPVPADDAAREERVKMTRLRATIARRLKDAQNTAAMLTTYNEVDMSGIMELRNTYKDQFEKKHGTKLGFMSFFVKACIHALKEIPEVNAEIDGQDVVYKNYVHMGVAVGTPNGLVVPVLRDADQMGFAAIEKKIAELGLRARDGKLSMAEMQGGSFTISNGGVYGSLMSSPILNPPQSGILGMHKIQDRPVVVNGQIVIRPMMYLALSYDHRIVDGKGAVTFLVRVKDALEDPRRLLMDL
jgi:2-oxoglutarate dehydrogenase complex dihydrolipoamide succinyltransferase (E2) component